MEFNPGGTWNQTTGSKFTFSAKYYNCIVGKKKIQSVLMINTNTF